MTATYSWPPSFSGVPRLNRQQPAFQTARLVSYYPQTHALDRIFSTDYDPRQVRQDLARIVQMGGNAVTVPLPLDQESASTTPPRLNSQKYFMLTGGINADTLARFTDFMAACRDAGVMVYLRMFAYGMDYTTSTTVAQTWLQNIANALPPGHTLRLMELIDEIAWPTTWAAFTTTQQNQATWAAAVLPVARTLFPGVLQTLSTRLQGTDGGDGVRGILAAQAQHPFTLDWIGLHFWQNGQVEHLASYLQTCKSLTTIPLWLDQVGYTTHPGAITNLNLIPPTESALIAWQDYAHRMTLDVCRKLSLPDNAVWMLHDQPTAPPALPVPAALTAGQITQNAGAGSLAAGNVSVTYTLLQGSLESPAAPALTVTVAAASTSLTVTGISAATLAAYSPYVNGINVYVAGRYYCTIRLRIASAQQAIPTYTIYAIPASGAAPPLLGNAAGTLTAGDVHNIAYAWLNDLGICTPCVPFPATVGASGGIGFPARVVPWNATGIAVYNNTVKGNTTMGQVSIQTGLTPGSLTTAVSIGALGNAGTLAPTVNGATFINPSLSYPVDASLGILSGQPVSSYAEELGRALFKAARPTGVVNAAQAVAKTLVGTLTSIWKSAGAISTDANLGFDSIVTDDFGNNFPANWGIDRSPGSVGVVSSDNSATNTVSGTGYSLHFLGVSATQGSPYADVTCNVAPFIHPLDLTKKYTLGCSLKSTGFPAGATVSVVLQYYTFGDVPLTGAGANVVISITSGTAGTWVTASLQASAVPPTGATHARVLVQVSNRSGTPVSSFNVWVDSITLV